MVRERRRRASPRWGDPRLGLAAVARWWGCCAVNEWADRAGSHRRIAAALAVLPFPLVGLAVVLVVDGRSSTGYALAHLAVAASSGWLAADLLSSASALNRHHRPHASSVSLLVGIGLLVGQAPVEPAVGFGPPMLLLTGMAALMTGYLVVVGAERQRDRFVAIVGRWSIVLGAVVVGAVEVGQMVLRFSVAPARAIGLGAVAFVLLVMGWCEARVLLRGVALFRALAQR